MTNKGFIGYKINRAYFLSYPLAIDEKTMADMEANNEIIASSRIYFICKVKQKGFLKLKLSEPEVLYVGETFNKKKRFCTHKKLLQAIAQLKRKEHIGICFVNVRHSVISINPTTNPINIWDDIKNQQSKTSIRLLERFFIKLFRPPLNQMHNNDKLKDDDLIVKKLLNNNIHYVHLDIGMNESLFAFRGGLREKDEDLYTYDLQNERIITGTSVLKEF